MLLVDYGFDEFEVVVFEEQVCDVCLVLLVLVVLFDELMMLYELLVELWFYEVIELCVLSVLVSVGELLLFDLLLFDDGCLVWVVEFFECLLFDVVGLILVVLLVCFGLIYLLENQELILLFGQFDWFFGILLLQVGNLKVLDIVCWVMFECYCDDYCDGFKYVILVQGYEWGLVVYQVSCLICFDLVEVKWCSQCSQWFWLVGMVIEYMCVLLDVVVFVELIVSGVVKCLYGDY